MSKGNGGTRNNSKLNDMLSDYVAYPSINEFLILAGDGYLNSYQKDMVNTLDNNMTAIGSKKDLYRFTDTDQLNDYLEQAGVDSYYDLKGERVVNTPYMSTTKLSYSSAVSEFSDKYVDNMSSPVVMKITTTKNTKVIDVNQHLKGAHYKNEKEVIISRNSLFKIKNVENRKIAGEKVLYVEMEAVD